MSNVQGLNPQIMQQLLNSQDGDLAEVTSQQQSKIYENNVQLSRIDSPPADVDASFTPTLDAPRQQSSTSNSQVYDRFNLTNDDFAVGLTTILATIMLETNQQIKRTNRESRAASVQAEAALIKQQAEEIRSAGMMKMVGAITSGALQIGSAAATGGMAVKAAKTNNAGIEAGKKAETTATKGALDDGMSQSAAERAGADAAARVQQPYGNQAHSLNNYSQSVGQLTGGVERAIGGGFDFAATGHDAARTELEAEKSKLEQNRNEINDLIQTVSKVTQDALDALSKVQGAEASLMSRIYQI
jgi:hypothetical protein